MKEIPEELLPVIEWWEKNGKQAIVTVVVAAVVAAGYYGFKSHQESQRKAASSVQRVRWKQGGSVDQAASREGIL